MLFPKGGRPDRAAIASALRTLPRASISFDPGTTTQKVAGSWADGVDSKKTEEANSWLELLVDGLTFDLVGLAPGPGISVPECEFRIDFDSDIAPRDHELIGLAPGPHLTGGANSLFVARAMAGLACDLANHFERIAGYYWLPSRSVTGAGFFRSTIAAWLDGGPFPALGMSGFRILGDGGVQSVGLEFFTGQEVRIPPLATGDATAATRLGMRIVHHLAMRGPLSKAESLVGPDGTNLLLEPAEDGRLILVRGA